MLIVNIIFYLTLLFGLVACDQVRDKLVNGFNFSVNKNESSVHKELPITEQKKNQSGEDANLTGKPIAPILQSPSSSKTPNSTTFQTPKKTKTVPRTENPNGNGMKDSDW